MARRAVLVVLAVVALVAAACSGTVAGTGHRGDPGTSAAPSSPPMTAFPSLAPTPVPVPTTLHRAVVHTVLGDPGRADVCTLLGGDVAGLGNLRAYDIQSAGRCSWDVSKPDGTELGSLDIDLMKPGGYGSVPGTSTSTVNGLTETQFPYTSGYCGRILADGAFDVEVSYDSDPEGAGECAGSDRAVAAVAAVLVKVHAPLDVRNFGSTSVVDADMCRVLKAAPFTSDRDFADADVADLWLGASCEVDGSDDASAQLHVVLMNDESSITSLYPAKVGSSTVYERQQGKTCEEYVELVTDGPVTEALNLNTFSTPDCDAAERLAADAAHALGR